MHIHPQRPITKPFIIGLSQYYNSFVVYLKLKLIVNASCNCESKSQTGKSVLYSINDLSIVFDADVEIIRFCLIHKLVILCENLL